MFNLRNKVALKPDSPNWCPGCGNFGIWIAFKDAAELNGWDNQNTVLVAGIGCHGHILNFLSFSSFEGLHGRPIPAACGVKMTNQSLNVFVFTGDGDCLGEGGNHFIHAARRNQNITVIIHNNSTYALTTGQTSPCSSKNYHSKSTPGGNSATPIFPLHLAISSGATFAARAYSGDIVKLSQLMKEANDHQGFSVIEVLQPCVTFNRQQTHMLYQKRIRALDLGHDVTDREGALEKTYEIGGQIPVGVFLKINKPTFEESVPMIDNDKLFFEKNNKNKMDEMIGLWRRYS